MIYKLAVLWTMLSALLLLLFAPKMVLAQEGVKVVINGEPRLVDGTVEASVSVNTAGGTVVNLPSDAFIIHENHRQVPPEELSLMPMAAGIGLVIVVDRGGIAARNGCQGPTNQLRISEAKEMATELVNSLVIQVEGAADDMIAIVGIDEKDDSGNAVFWPDQNFSFNLVDRNLALNALEPIDAPEYLLRDQSVTTPLYEGLYRGLNLLTANSNPDLRAALATRQRMILIFSDGIDRDYSDDVIESDILRIANEHNVIIHAVGMACRDGGRLVENSLRRLSANSQGSYWRHSSEAEHMSVTAGLQNLLTYRQQYNLRFPSRLSGGTHRLSVQVRTELGADETTASFISTLQAPRLTLAGPPNGYIVDETAALTASLPITATIEFADGINREVTVEFAVNDAVVFSTTSQPARYDWGLDQLGVGSHTLSVIVTDSQLGERLREERTIQITPAPTPTPVPAIPGPTTSATGNLAIWMVPILIFLTILLFVLLYRTQASVQKVVVAGARGIRATTMKLTQKLGPAKLTLAKLTVMRGPNHGEEYRLTEDVTRFGRDTERCDKIIPGAYISSLHFSIMYNTQQQVFYIMDHRSTNGTYLNRQQLPPDTYQHLPFGSIISIGQNHEVELSFQPVARTTKVLHSPGP